MGAIVGAAVVIASPAVLIPSAPVIETVDLRFREAADVRALLFRLTNEHPNWRFETQDLAPGLLITMVRRVDTISTAIVHNSWPKKLR